MFKGMGKRASIRKLFHQTSGDATGSLLSQAIAVAISEPNTRQEKLRYLLDVQPIWVFVAGAAAIGVLADWVRRATEQLAHRAGATIGGLLNVSFGNIAELVLALFVLSEAETQVVQAQITGSIIGTTLLFLGISALVGGIGRTRQTFDKASVGLLSTLLFLVVVAILLPAVFDLTERTTAPAAQISLIDEHLSLSVSVVLLVLYVGNLTFNTTGWLGVFTDRNGFLSGRAFPWWLTLPSYGALAEGAF